jgi:hypothetical protein
VPLSLPARHDFIANSLQSGIAFAVSPVAPLL